MSEKFYIGKAITTFEDNGERKPVSRVTLMLDAETGYTAGDDTGAEVVAGCSFATQALANSVLTKLRGYTYNAFAAGAANLDPAAELGDGVTVSGLYATLSHTDEDGFGYPSIKAPGARELEDEYPLGSPLMNTINRTIATVRATLRVDIDEISARVDGLDGDFSELRVDLTSVTARVQNAEGNISELSVDLDGVTTRVSSAEGNISELSVDLDGVTTRVSSVEGDFSELKVTVDGVTVTDASGTTRIKGSSIDTSTIKANSISADMVNLTGAITFGDLASDVSGGINNASSTASSAYSLASSASSKASSAQSTANAAQSTISSWKYGSTTYIDGGMLMTNTVRASTLEGGAVALLNSGGGTVGTLTMTGAYTATYAVALKSYGALRLMGEAGAIYLESGDGTALQLSDTISVGFGDFHPNQDGTYSCGTASFPWSEVYADTEAIITSDAGRKNSIAYGLAEYGGFFDALRPASFKYNNGTSGRTHIGLIAQDVAAALDASGLTTQDFAGYIKAYSAGKETDVYALRYGEFIALCIAQIQQLKQRVSVLEGSI